MALTGTVAGDAKIGNTTIPSAADPNAILPTVVVQLDARGAVRWSTVAPTAERIAGLVDTSSDEVVYVGSVNDGEYRLFVRKLAL